MVKNTTLFMDMFKAFINMPNNNTLPYDMSSLSPEALHGLAHAVLEAGVVAALVPAAALLVLTARLRRSECPGGGALGPHRRAPAGLVTETEATEVAEAVVAVVAAMMTTKASKPLVTKMATVMATEPLATKATEALVAMMTAMMTTEPLATKTAEALVTMMTTKAMVTMMAAVLVSAWSERAAATEDAAQQGLAGVHH